MSFEPEQLSHEEAHANVEETIENNEVALFMKGTEMMPQCGYSRKALGLIGQYRDEVATVNVLTATEAYREKLAEYSGRETIPQTFVDGEFGGGIDILEQLDDNGDLAETLNA